MNQKYMVVRDKRLHGGVPARPGMAIQNLDALTPLRVFFNHASHVAGPGKIHSLFGLCHGYAGANTKLRVSMDAGGMGLEVGQEGVTHSNVAAWASIKNKVSNIVIYACAAAPAKAWLSHRCPSSSPMF